MNMQLHWIIIKQFNNQILKLQKYYLEDQELSQKVVKFYRRNKIETNNRYYNEIVFITVQDAVSILKCNCLGVYIKIRTSLL